VSSASGGSSRIDALGGIAFVLLWSTGYIAAHFALLGFGPYSTALLRFLGSAALIGLWLLLRRPSGWGKPAAWRRIAVAGVLLQAGFFGLLYAAMQAGVAPAVAGLISGLMPLTTALLAVPLLGERLGRPTLIGLALGLSGVLLVVGPQLHGGGALHGYAFAVGALLALSLGTVLQKRGAVALDARVSLLIQLLASAAVIALPVAFHEGLRVSANPIAIAGVVWAIVVNSCAGLLLYLWLIHRGTAARAAGLFYLVPPATAVFAALTLGTSFGLRECAGFGLAALGVWFGIQAGRVIR